MSKFSRKSFFIIFTLTLALTIVMGFQNCANVLEPKSNKSASMCPHNDCTGYLKEDFYYVISSDVHNNYGSTDILFVIDNSASMLTEQNELALRFSDFSKAVKGLDFQIAITNTSFNSDNGALETLSNGQKVITPQTSNLETIFKNSVVLGETGDDIEQGIASSIQAFNTNEGNWIRDEAIFQVVVLSDEDECSFANRPNPVNTLDFTNIVEDLNMYLPHPGFTQAEKNDLINGMHSDYLTKVVSPTNSSCNMNSEMNSPQAFKNTVGDKGIFHSIVVNDETCRQAQLEGFWVEDVDGAYTLNGTTVNPGYNIGHMGSVYSQLSQETGGVVGNICAQSYSNQLDFIGDQISHITRSTFYLRCKPVGAVKVVLKDNHNNLLLGITHTVNEKSLTFSQPLTLGTQIEAEYYCAP